MPGTDEGRLSTAEAARRLGIKVETLYAYVSRGLLASTRVPGGRGSTFAVSELDRLAGSGRPRARMTEPFRFPSISTSVTLVRDGELSYRGHGAVRLSAAASFEQVTELLWRDPDDASAPGDRRWELPAATGAAVRRAVRALPATADLGTCLRVGLATAATLDPLRHDLRPATVRRTARLAIAALVDGVAATGRRSRQPGSTAGLADRLLAGLAARSPAPAEPARAASTPAGPTPAAAQPTPAAAAEPAVAGCLQAALVLLADHGLAASTVAARVAASARADPYAVVGAGLGVLDSPLHGAASAAARALLVEIDAGVHPGAAVGSRLRAGHAIPGIGHSLYPSGDPRAAALLERLTAIPAAGRWLAAARAVEWTLSGRGGDPGGDRANIDLALAVLTLAADLPADAGEVVFAVARTAGWIAHALEEYGEQPLRWRGRELYTGVEPSEAPEPDEALGPTELVEG